MPYKPEDFTEFKEMYAAVVDEFVNGNIDETRFRMSLANLGFKAVEIDREVELSKEERDSK